ncbi:MAG: rod shape-determining protein MreC [Bacteroidales bacterium]|jgi:rod shape-determining protein MreC|nr:rod shape-determining protein MreC [Bacteroidales bacterium]MDD4215643.1 rod shape-determining protein MreC [Bacteroidales bacterium]
MRPLLNFLIKYYYFFLFILLEVLAVYLIARNNYYPQSVFISSANAFSGKVYNSYNNITNYLSLKSTNKLLAEENAVLLTKQISSFRKTTNKTFVVNDTLYQQQYEYTSAEVISNTVTRANNYLTLNKGLKQGIRKDMGVITSLGVVGIVKDVSTNFSTVTSLLHSQSKISAKIKKNDYVGTITWEEKNHRIAMLNDIPTHVTIKPGDTIITSGYSLIFPEGINIGTILYSQKDQGSNFYKITIRLFADFNNLSYVYVVKSLMREELQNLKAKTQNDETDF